MSEAAENKANGWLLKCHDLFLARYTELIEEVERLAADDPHEFHRHPAFRLLTAVTKAIQERVPADPGSRDFACASLGNGGLYRRVKQGLPNRYRLFFCFRSDTRTIIYLWLNDELSLRKSGSKTDVYRVFLALVRQGRIVGNYDDILRESKYLPKTGSTPE